MTRTPNFVSWRAAILHRADDNIERLKRQLERLGVTVLVQWKPLDLTETPADIVLVDADQGGTISCHGDGDAAPVPVVRAARVRSAGPHRPGRSERAPARSSPSLSPPPRFIQRWCLPRTPTMGEPPSRRASPGSRSASG
ncbi:hypothetical protein ACVOMV_03885 [Mesorhizobium atlanticum]